ncbi:hypothetical protein HY285_01240, partial [Candidatus Peregrinibacteria bacterium]|nr:hypothetical protein [Candidatus Peregrinibacteria bacterium]
MPIKDADLGKILLEQSYLSEADLQMAEKQAKDRDVPFKSVLIELGLLTQ